MSSAVDALIPQIANYNPAGFALKNQQLAGQNALAAAQTQAEQARVPYIQQQTAGLAQEQAIKQQQLQDAQIVRQAYMNTDGDPDNLKQYMLKNGISGTGFMGWQQHSYDLLSKAQAYTKGQADLEEKLHNLAGNAVDSLNNIKDDGEMQRSYQQQLPTLQREAPDIPWKPQATRDDLNFYSGVLGHASAVLAQAKERQAIATAAAQEQKDIEETRKAKLTNDLLEKSQQGGDPAELTGGQHPIAAIGQGLPANDPTMVGLMHMYDQGRRMPTIENGIARYPMSERAMETMAQYQKSIGEATNPQLRAGKVQTAVQENTALAPFKRQEAVDTAVATERAKAQLSPDAFNAIIDPTARNRALNDWTKANSTYQDEVTSADKLLRYVAAARAGNQTAAAQIPIAELRSIVSRVTNQELEATGEGLSIGRKIFNLGDKAFTGKPTEETLGEYEQLANIMKDTATRGYAGRMLPLQQQGAKVSLAPMQLPSNLGGTATTSSSKGKLTDPNIARQYLTKAGGDKEKARQLAKQDGWTF